ncbi:hypothetical protein BGY98DRAFT_1181250 [Russula aff. rugulosa BPL654]|nr:hypothetical protein BGY98DRAFT_1181250 [Russula aff. rugulosa BPL654]
MKEKRQVKPLLDGQQQDAEEFLCLFLDALGEELPALLPPISGRQSPSGQTEVGGQGFVANLVESPITRIFGESSVRPSSRKPVRPSLQKLAITPSRHPDALMRVSNRSLCRTPIRLEPMCQQISSRRFLRSRSPSQAFRTIRCGGIMKIGKSSSCTRTRNPTRYDFHLLAAAESKILRDLVISDIMVPNVQRPSEPPHYKLYGVLYHHGESADSGHYTVDVLHPNGEGDQGKFGCTSMMKQ